MKNNNRKVAQKYQWPYLWIRIYIFTLNEEQDKIKNLRKAAALFGDKWFILIKQFR